MKGWYDRPFIFSQDYNNNFTLAGRNNLHTPDKLLIQVMIKIVHIYREEFI